MKEMKRIIKALKECTHKKKHGGLNAIQYRKIDKYKGTLSATNHFVALLIKEVSFFQLHQYIMAEYGVSMTNETGCLHLNNRLRKQNIPPLIWDTKEKIYTDIEKAIQKHTPELPTKDVKNIGVFRFDVINVVGKILNLLSDTNYFFPSQSTPLSSACWESETYKLLAMPMDLERIMD